MEIPLLYPPDTTLKSVKVGLITVEVIKLISNRSNHIDGSLPFKILASMCKGVSPDTLKDIAMVDANRILFNSWRLTHGAEVYTAKQYCECKLMNFFQHDLTKNYVRTDIYDKPHTIKALCPETLKEKEYSIKLQPLKFSINSELMQLAVSNNEDKLTDLLLLNRINSINDKPVNDLSLINMRLYKAISKLTDEDTRDLNSMVTVEQTCLKCEKVNSHTISWLDANFLQGE